MSREPPLDHTANCLKAFDDGQRRSYRCCAAPHWRGLPETQRRELPAPLS